MRTQLFQMATGVTLSTVLLLGGCKSSPAPVAPTQAPAEGASTTNGVAAPGAQPAPGTASTPAAGSPAQGPGVAPSGVVGAPPRVSEPESAVARVAPPPRVRVAPAGSRVAVTVTETLKASTSNVGDGFTGVLAEPLVSKGGGTVFERGTRVAGTVVASKGRGRFKGAGALGIQLTSIGGVRVSSSEYEKSREGQGEADGGVRWRGRRAGRHHRRDRWRGQGCADWRTGGSGSWSGGRGLHGQPRCRHSVGVAGHLPADELCVAVVGGSRRGLT